MNITISAIESLSKATQAILRPPFEWRPVEGGSVILQNAAHEGGTEGGSYQVTGFAIAKFPITNAQYEKFLENPNGFANPRWWEYSDEAMLWRRDHRNPKPTAFGGPDLPRTRASWFDSMAFCHWLSGELESRVAIQREKPLDPRDPLTWSVRLPTEQEWQRAALGDTGWCYPWGDRLDGTRANYGNLVGQTSSVDRYPDGKSIYGAMDMIGNVWEWSLTGWDREDADATGYVYRVIKGGAWNISNPDHLRANDRGCHPPRGRLNDCGFRALLCLDSCRTSL
jgi:formylglycine-generating enzyme required for sulfatase activity